MGSLKTILLSQDPRQALRMQRHLAAFASILVFSLACLYFYFNGMLVINGLDIVNMFLVFWLGMFVFTLLIRTGLNEKFKDPSMTLAQVLWSTIFLLTIIYSLNTSRAVALMCYFAIFSFGFFKLSMREFATLAAVSILGYMFIIIYIYINEPLRIRLYTEILQLVAFSMTTIVMVYTGSAISKLRKVFRQRNLELAEALRLNTRLATTDDLTELYTRRYLMDMLANQKALSERDDSDFVVIYADLDHFKHINDSYGHHTGDIVLKKFSKILQSSIREIDYASRFGGEEFVVLLVNTDIEKAKAVAERIRQGIENYNFFDLAPGLKVTVSIGMANYKQYKSIQETLMTADNRMYKAKEQGRNLTVFE